MDKNEFKNKDLSFEFSNNWNLVKNDLENCIAILDSKSGYSRVMVIKYPEEGLSLNYLKLAIEDIPREDSLKIQGSDLTILANKDTHELIAIDESHDPSLKTHSLACINGRDAYVFNFMSFGLNNPDENDFLFMYESLNFLN